MYYCLYFYDGTNSITGRFPFTCVDDTLAQSIAKLHAQGTSYELWNRNRLVTRRQEISEDVDFATGLRRPWLHHLISPWIRVHISNVT